MKLVVLVDNNTLNDKYYIGEPAVSYYIEVDGKKVLFDTGYSDVFIRNARKMNINVDNIDAIAISHGHEDHSNGLKYYLDNVRDKRILLYAHPLAFNKKKLDGEMICSPYSLDLLSEYFEIRTSKNPINLTDNLIFLGEIPSELSFEKRYSMGRIKIDGEYRDDYLYDDSALVYKGKNGLLVISGCSHSGICNIIEYAKKVCNDDRVVAVIGGFHLTYDDERLKETIDYFENNNIKNIYPCHCTSLVAKSKFINRLGSDVNEVGVSLEIEME